MAPASHSPGGGLVGSRFGSRCCSPVIGTPGRSQGHVRGGHRPPVAARAGVPEDGQARAGPPPGAPFQPVHQAGTAVGVPRGRVPADQWGPGASPQTANSRSHRQGAQRPARPRCRGGGGTRPRGAASTRRRPAGACPITPLTAATATAARTVRTTTSHTATHTTRSNPADRRSRVAADGRPVTGTRPHPSIRQSARECHRGPTRRPGNHATPSPGVHPAAAWVNAARATAPTNRARAIRQRRGRSGSRKQTAPRRTCTRSAGTAQRDAALRDSDRGVLHSEPVGHLVAAGAVKHR